MSETLRRSLQTQAYIISPLPERLLSPLALLLPCRERLLLELTEVLTWLGLCVFGDGDGVLLEASELILETEDVDPGEASEAPSVGQNSSVAAAV